MKRHLVFRCPSCRATTSVEAEWLDARPAEVACSSCNVSFRLDAHRDRAGSDQAYAERVRKYAVESHLDLASAYSVLEEIMPPDRVRKLAPTSPEIPHLRSGALRPVVLLATLILSLGFLARTLRNTGSPAGVRDGDGALASTATNGVRTTSPPSESAERIRIVPVSYQVDEAGRLTKVIAPDPRTALISFCQHDSIRSTLRPVSIAPAQPPSPGLRFGVMQEEDEDSKFAWVRIRLDSQTGRWIIGDGGAPIGIDRDKEPPAGAELLTF